MESKMPGLLKQNLQVDQRVKMVQTTDPNLDNQEGTILGRATNPDAVDFYIVLLDTPRPTGEKAIVLIESCLDVV
jgi:hypothetical protein